MITLRDVARRAGVSVSTASNALSGTRGVSSATAEAVAAAAAELGYRRNETARSLRTGLRNAIALVVPDLTNPFWAGIVGVIESRASSLGWSLTLCNTDYDAMRELEYLARLTATVDGVILLSTAPYPAALTPLVASGIPVVACDERVELDGIGGVYSENRGGGRTAARHLLERGGSRFVALGGPARLATPFERVEGFVSELLDAGVAGSDISVIDVPYSFDGGREGARRVISEVPDADAVFACSDNQAMGLTFGLEDLGRSVPRDVLVCGFDGISWSERVRPSITTLQQNAIAMAETAFEMIAEMIGEDAEPRTVVLPVKLIARESTRREPADSS